MTTLSPDLRRLITERKNAKDAEEKKQLRLITDAEIFHEKIRAALSGLLESNQFDSFSRCGKEKLYRTCKDCGDCHEFDYRCSLKWCPRCNWVIGRRRAALIKKWQKRVSHPMHLVLTQRNFAVLTGRKLSQHTEALARLRRQKVFKHVKGGCVSVELTHEDRGWHLHSHWLVDATWISMQELAVKWGKLVGQEFGIVHYDQLRREDYCNEVCKYVVKGSEMSDWPPERMNEFVQAIRGHRFFGTFGTLWHQQKEVRAEIEAEKPPPPVCDCGSENFIYRSELSELLHEIESES